MRAIAISCAMGVVAMLGTAASAAIFDFQGHTYTTEFNAGAGDNKSIMALEYSPATTYLFGYSWTTPTSGQKQPTGTDMLYALRDASGGTLSVLFQTFTFDLGNGPVSSDYIKAISYGSHQVTYNPDTSYWNYFVSTDGATWESPLDFGASDRPLTQGSWDDWVYQTQAALPPNYDIPTLPSFSTAPEPASLGVLALAGMFLLRRKKR